MAIGIDAERLEGDELRRRGWLTFLAEASELLANSLDLDLTTALVAQLAVPRLGTWSAVHLLTLRGGIRPVAVAHTDEHAVPRIRALLGEASTAAVKAQLARVLVDAAPVTLAGDLAGVALPLVARGRAIGVLSVGRFPDRAHVGEDVAMLADFARRSALAIDNATAHAERIRVANELQQALLPPELPKEPGIEFGAVYVPAGTGDVGGDFYDVFPVRRNRWFVSIGDICGKGTQAAVVTGVVRDVMRVLVGDDRPAGRMLASLNRSLLARPNDRYATVAVAMVTRLELPDRSRVLEVALCLAGHDRPILLRADGTTRAVGECGTAVGLVEQFDVSEVVVTLRQGEALVFFTDGVTERRDGSRMYGTRRLRQLLSVLAGQPAQVIAGRIQAEVLRFAAEPPRDDIAVLVLRNPL
jgi:serine phosphatase RsbU (regulator of sigma subunit)